MASQKLYPSTTGALHCSIGGRVAEMQRVLVVSIGEISFQYFKESATMRKQGVPNSFLR